MDEKRQKYKVTIAGWLNRQQEKRRDQTHPVAGKRGEGDPQDPLDGKRGDMMEEEAVTAYLKDGVRAKDENCPRDGREEKVREGSGDVSEQSQQGGEGGGRGGEQQDGRRREEETTRLKRFQQGGRGEVQKEGRVLMQQPSIRPSTKQEQEKY